MTLTYACTYVNILSYPKHDTILILYVRIQLCQTTLSVDNVGYCVGYAWPHYDMDVTVQGRSAFPKDNVGKSEVHGTRSLSYKKK